MLSQHFLLPFKLSPKYPSSLSEQLLPWLKHLLEPFTQSLFFPCFQTPMNQSLRLIQCRFLLPPWLLFSTNSYCLGSLNHSSPLLPPQSVGSTGGGQFFSQSKDSHHCIQCKLWCKRNSMHPLQEPALRRSAKFPCLLSASTTCMDDPDLSLGIFRNYYLSWKFTCCGLYPRGSQL